MSTYPARAWCSRCGHRDLASRMVSVQVCRQTHWEPAEFEPWCWQCNDKAVQQAEMDEERAGLSFEEWSAL